MFWLITYSYHGWDGCSLFACPVFWFHFKNTSVTKKPKSPATSASSPSKEAKTLIGIQHHQGPLPDPNTLQRYEEVKQGFAERIMMMAEANNQFRIQISHNSLKAKSREVFIGQVFGLLIGLGGLCTAAFLGYLGESTAASVIGGTTVVGLVTAFIQGRKVETSDSKKRATN
nr:DUF2335 domain-containing protein [Leptolyngbya sp. FACHB-17]